MPKKIIGNIRNKIARLPPEKQVQMGLLAAVFVGQFANCRNDDPNYYFRTAGEGMTELLNAVAGITGDTKGKLTLGKLLAPGYFLARGEL